MNNKVVHFEIPADDLSRARDFYSKTFNWEFEIWDDNYLSVRTPKSDKKGSSTEPGSINGGIQKRGPRAKTPTVVIQVNDIEATLDTVASNGGTVVVGKEMMGDTGFYAQFDDTEGNRIGLFESVK